MGKKKKGEGHHGGAWKVAYADFVTAMMALFMVLWIVAQDDEIIILTAEYFQNPFGNSDSDSVGVFESDLSGSGSENNIVEFDNLQTSPVDISFLGQLAADLYKMIDVNSESLNESVEVNMYDDSLRLTIFDRPHKKVFIKDSSEFTEWGKYIIQNLSWIIDQYPMKMRVDGHALRRLNDDLDPWALTTERANAARQLVEFYSLEEGRVYQISGFGDTQPLQGYQPDAPEHDRLEMSLLLRQKMK